MGYAISKWPESSLKTSDSEKKWIWVTLGNYLELPPKFVFRVIDKQFDGTRQ